MNLIPSCAAEVRLPHGLVPAAASIARGRKRVLPASFGGVSLIHLTKSLNVAPADESTPEIEERLMDVVSALVANLQPPEAIQPRESVLSTTHLYRPSFSPDSMPRQAICGVMPLFLSALRHRGKS
jgi:hypothetical protein